VFLLAYISSTKKWYYFIFSFFYNATVRVLSQPRRPLIGTYIPVYGGGGVPVVFEKKKVLLVCVATVCCIATLYLSLTATIPRHYDAGSVPYSFIYYYSPT